MATSTVDRPAFSFSGQADLDLVTTSAALGDTPGTFGAMSQVDLAASSVTTTNLADDTLGCEVRIMNGATVLAAADSGGTWVVLAANTAGPASSISTSAIQFGGGTNYVNTAASKATWDGASVEYRQRYTKNKGGDLCYVSSSAVTNNVTFTYNEASSFPLGATDIESTSNVSTPALGVIRNTLADEIESATNVSTPASEQIHVLISGEIESASEVSTPATTLIRNLAARDIESTSNVSTPIATHDTQNELLADNIETASEFTTPTAVENAEYMRADADNSIGNWTTDSGGTINLFQQIDEVTANDSDYIRSELNPQTSASRFSLSNLVETIEPDNNHVIRYRYRKDDANGQQIDLTVRLIEGASTVVASWVHTNISATIVEAEQSLTAPQKASIINPDNLFIEFEANGP